jgi:hypothetical protein
MKSELSLCNTAQAAVKAYSEGSICLHVPELQGL